MTSTGERPLIKKLGLLAGSGELPLALIRSALKENVEIVCFALNKKTYQQAKDLCPSFLFSPIEVFQILEQIKKLDIKQLSFIGKVEKLDFFRNIHRLDLRLVAELKKLQNFSDDSLHFRIVDFLEKEHGLQIIDQTLFLKEFFPQAQVFTSRKPSTEELVEIDFGFSMAKSIGELDIGQTVIIQNKAVIAVEAIEGTNNCIKRASKLGSKDKQHSLIVCKVSKPNQDKRFDVPTVGLGTITRMPANSILAFEAGETFFVDQQASIKLAERKGITIIAV